MKKIKGFIALILAIALFGGGVFVGFKIDNFTLIKHDVTYSSEIIKDQITELSDLTTLKESLTGQEYIEDAAMIKGFKIPFTTKKLLVQYKGIVKVSTDLNKVKVDISEENGETTINVSLKKCTISDMYIDEKSWKYLDQKSYVFNRLKPEDDGKLRDKVMETLKSQAEANKVIDRGNEQAKEAVTQLLSMAYPDANVVVEIR